MAKYVTPILVLAVAVLAIALFIRGGEVITALIINTTNSSYATVNLTNVAPQCEPAIASTGVFDSVDNGASISLLTGGNNTYVKVNTTCNDPNGIYDFVNFTGQFSDTTATVPCTASNRNCSINNSCQNVSKNTTAYIVQCTYMMWYNAENTSQVNKWFGNISVGDTAGNIGRFNDSITMNELLAIGTDSLLAFGAKSANANDSTLAQTLNLYNYGNVEMDFQVNGSQMQCTSGSFNAEYLKVNTTSTSETYALGLPLTGTLQSFAYERSYFNLTANTTLISGQVPNPPSKATYWGIGIPPGVSGNCQSTIWFAAILS